MMRKQTSRAKRHPASPRSRAAKARTRPAQIPREELAGDELPALVVRGCLIARDAVFNVRDFLADGSRLAFLAIKDCEKELDQIERKIDEQLPEAITRVGEAKARELLACLKFITDLERIGDLAYSAVMQLQARREKLPAADSRQLIEMASLLCAMLEQVHQGFLKRDVAHAQSVLQSDPEVDRLVPFLVSQTSGRAEQSDRTKEFRHPSRRPGAGAHRRSRQESGGRTLRPIRRPLPAPQCQEALVGLGLSTEPAAEAIRR